MTYYTAIDLTNTKATAGQLVDRLQASSAEVVMHLEGSSAYMIVKTPKEVNSVVWAASGFWASGSYADAEILLAIAKAIQDLTNHRAGLAPQVSPWAGLEDASDH